jgi:hypothetical protein
MIRRRRSVRGPRKKGVWCNVPFGSVAFTESSGSQVLLVPEDWESQFTGLANEQAILRTIQGSITVQQTVIGTAGTTGFWGIYIAGEDRPTPPVFTVTGMSDVDWLLTGCFGTQSALSTSSYILGNAPYQVHTRSKRKLRSRDSVYICAQFGADAASPAGVLGGLLRFYVARD